MSDKHDLETEMQRQREELMDRIRGLTRQIRLKHLIIDSYIPAAEYMKIERRALWDQETKQYTIQKIEFTGNYIKKNKEKKKKGLQIEADTSPSSSTSTFSTSTTRRRRKTSSRPPPRE